MVKLQLSEMKKLKPCDCIDMTSAQQLNEQGIGHNDDSIRIEPNSVIIQIGLTTNVKIPMNTFKKYAEWYLQEQEINK